MPTKTWTCLAVAVLLAAGPALAQKLKGSKKQEAPKIDLGLPTFSDLPKGEDMKRKTEPAPVKPHIAGPSATWTVVRVIHGKSFIKTTQGAKPSAAFDFLPVSGTPFVTEAFSSIIRLKHPEKRSASIEVAVLDPRGDTVMEASGTVYFRGGDEAEWQVDWAPSNVRRVGDFKVLVRVAGNPLGTFPLKVSETKK